ncbi:MAG: hypothetical protein FWC09_02920 [Lachnospiraceae bacterium]|nr:hypothetical protein [Lachnospiraceae bacterium]
MKRKIIASISIIALILASIIIFVLSAPNTKPLYGKFTYINEDGSIAVITLTESTVKIENLESDEYKNQEKGAAFRFAYDYLIENDLPLELGETFDEIQRGFMENMDFASIFENKELIITEIHYFKEHNRYDYFVDNPLDGTPGIKFWFDIKKKELNIGLKVFTYSR